MTESELRNKLENTISHLEAELAQVRTGRVTPALLDSVLVDAYGSNLTVKEVGTINSIDAQTLQISPWDKGLLEPLAKAIRESELNLNPTVSNDSVIVPVPSLTEERRKEFTRLVSTKVEDAKSALRNIRQDAMKAIDTSFSNKEFGEDEKFSKKESVEDTVKEFVARANEMGENKKSDIMGTAK